MTPSREKIRSKLLGNYRRWLSNGRAGIHDGSKGNYPPACAVPTYSKGVNATYLLGISPSLAKRIGREGMREKERAQERERVRESLTARDGRLQGPPSHLQQGESKTKGAREKERERQRENSSKIRNHHSTARHWLWGPN